MAEWLQMVVVTTVVGGVGWLVTSGINNLRDQMAQHGVKLDLIMSRQAQFERDCVTWGDLEKVNLKVTEHDRRIIVVETRCASEHGD